MMYLIRHARLMTAADESVGDLLIEGERIAAVGQNLAERIGPQQRPHILDVDGLWAMPGGIDVHTHLELYSWETVSADDFYTGHIAAAFGGTTTHIDFANQVRGQTLRFPPGVFPVSNSFWRIKASIS